MVSQKEVESMARPKGSKNKKAPNVAPDIEDVVEEWIEFYCPKRGRVRQKVKVKKLKKVVSDQKPPVSSNDVVDDIELEEDSSILSTEDE